MSGILFPSITFQESHFGKLPLSSLNLSAAYLPESLSVKYRSETKNSTLTSILLICKNFC